MRFKKHKLSFFSLMIESDGVCSRDDFLCANDKCANASTVCDGKDDCGDNSDEGTVCSGTLIISFGYSIIKW